MNNIRKPHTTAQTLVIDQAAGKTHFECNVGECRIESRPSEQRDRTVSQMRAHAGDHR